MKPKKKWYIVGQSVWDAIPVSHWGEYGGPPAAVRRLNGYVLCTVVGLVEEKIDMFDAISGVQSFDSAVEVFSFKKKNFEIFNNPIE